MFLSVFLSAAVATAQPASPAISLAGYPIQFRHLQNRRDCELTIPKLSHLCAGDWFSDRTDIEAALADLDEDGLEDVAVRFRSLEGCGSHGCTTELYHARETGTFVRTSHLLVTDGPISRCSSGKTRGISFPVRGPSFACFPFPEP